MSYPYFFPHNKTHKARHYKRAGGVGMDGWVGGGGGDGAQALALVLVLVNARPATPCVTPWAQRT